MCNVYVLYSKKIKENRVKAFITELKDRGINICDCNECRSSQKNIVNLSYKIANQLDQKDELTESEHIEVIDNFAINLGCCILRPSYLVNFGRWEGDNLVDCNESNYMIFLCDLISDYSHLMNENERTLFGKKVEFISKLFICDDCYNNAA